MNQLVHPILIPAVGGLLALIVPRALKGVREIISLIATCATVYFAMQLFNASGGGAVPSVSYPWLTVEKFVLCLKRQVLIKRPCKKYEKRLVNIEKKCVRRCILHSKIMITTHSLRQ